MKTVKVLLLSFLLCFGFANVFANNGKHIQIYVKDIYSTEDTAIVQKSFYKHGKKFFMEKYRRDIIGITGTATGIYILNSYTRKKLYVLLRDYQRNGYLPQKYSERVEQWVEETKRERLLKERKARLKKEKERLKEEGAKAQ
ncbi:MAG: hypothetical protein NTX03_12065 [Bacteroidetes bacterium]|nr:hypothetical protein [Bacteroidota bacterium]